MKEDREAPLTTEGVEEERDDNDGDVAVSLKTLNPSSILSTKIAGKMPLAPGPAISKGAHRSHTQDAPQTKREEREGRETHRALHLANIPARSWPWT